DLRRLRRERPQLAGRADADRRAGALGAERDHGLRPLAAPDVGRRAVPALLPEDQQARRARPGDVLQRGLLAGRDHGRRRGRDLLVLERRLHVLVHPGADRLLPAAPAQAERAPARAAAGVHEVRRARDGGVLLRGLAVRRHLLLEDRPHARLLPGGLGCPRRLPAALLVPRDGRGQEGSARVGRDDPAHLVTAAPPSPGPVLLATEGRPIPAEAISAAAAAAGRGGRVHVFSIVRVWGTSLGLPNPGLLPSKRDWDEQRENVGAAVKALERLGVAAAGRAVA